MNHNYTVRYKNVELSPLQHSETENLRNWRNDEKNTRYLNKIPYITPDMQKQWYERYLNNNDEMCFSIYEISELHRMVGSLSLYNFSEDQAEFGKILVGDEAAHGKHIGTNALIAILIVAFEKIKLTQIILHVYNENLPAKHIYQDVGFYTIEKHFKDGMEELTMKITIEEYDMLKGKYICTT